MRYPLGDWLHNKISSRQEYKEKMTIYRDKQSQYVAKRLFEIYGFEIAQKYKPNYVQDFIPCMGADTPSQFKNRNSKTKMVFEIFMAWENEFVKIFTLFPEIHAPVLSHFTTLKHYS